MLRQALALIGTLAAAVGILGATGLSSALASAPTATSKPSAVTRLSQLVDRAKARELLLLKQVQTVRGQLRAERAEIGRARAQLAALISAEYTGTPNGLLEVLASGSLSQALDTQITLSRITGAEKAAVNQIAATIAAQRQSQRRLQLETARALATENRLRAEELVAAFQAANPPAATRPTPTAKATPSAPGSTVHRTKPATTPAAPSRTPASTPPPTPSPTATPSPTPASSPTPAPPPPSAAGGVFSTTTNLTDPSGITLGQIENFLQGTPLAADAGYFLAAQQTNHVSAIYLVSDAVLETGWGTSTLYTQKHNLFGFNAFDANPFGDGASFPSDQACISFVSWYVSVYYLTPPGSEVPNYPGQPGSVPTGQFYNGPTVAGMSVDYASDPSWATKIAQIGDLLQSTPG